MLQLYFLGTPTASFADAPLSGLNSSKIGMRLWAFLVMHRQQAHRRDRLATLFWPDISDARAHRTLNNLVWRLRTALGAAGDRLLVENNTLQVSLADGDWLDSTAFEQQLQALNQPVPNELFMQQRTRFEAALALYRGEFLAGIEDDWCLPVRETCRERYLQTLERFADGCQQHDDPEHALQLAQQVVGIDPYRQSAYQRLIELAMGLNGPMNRPPSAVIGGTSCVATNL